MSANGKYIANCIISDTMCCYNLEQQKSYQQTFENFFKDSANELSFFYFLFAIDILNDIVYQTILYSTQEPPEKPISIILMTLRNSLLLVLFICQS